MLLKYELRVFDYDGNMIFCEDFKSLNLAVRAAKCFDTDYVIMELENLVTDRMFPVYELDEVMFYA